uniref:CDT1 domain-containing protein n=1 Tax=Rhodnius prolixus TaxID=13249 RepID=T1I8X7_RHOPR
MISSVDNTKVPDSPSLLRRSVFLSPTKSAPNSLPYISPKKLFSDSFNSALEKSSPTSPNKQGAYERFYALACSGKPAFTLPFSYRSLAETFRAVDTVVSIMQNRNETIIFSKLRSSVQQLSKNHLGQIASVFPEAYSFSQEKIRILGNQNDSYELVIKPVFENKEEEKEKAKGLMTPSILLDRKRRFYNALLDIVKTHHEDFLKTLQPPLKVPKDKLTRWHPAFDVESCPEISAENLPQPPNIEKYSTAKDVLSLYVGKTDVPYSGTTAGTSRNEPRLYNADPQERKPKARKWRSESAFFFFFSDKARDIFGVNPRMEKALERLSENNVTNTTATSKSIPALANALKGIPKSLLEKVRARQAAKAVELLTRNPEENKRRYELTRLPELARLLRNIFVTEKKNIIAKPLLLTKLCESFREIMDQSEMAHHIELLRDTVPGWIIISVVDNKEFVKLCKETNLTVVLGKLNQLVAKNSISF